MVVFNKWIWVDDMKIKLRGWLDWFSMTSVLIQPIYSCRLFRSCRLLCLNNQSQMISFNKPGKSKKWQLVCILIGGTTRKGCAPIATTGMDGRKWLIIVSMLTDHYMLRGSVSSAIWKLITRIKRDIIKILLGEN